MKTFTLAILMILFFFGCGPDEWIAEIESDTSWKAEFETDGSIYKTEEGSGNRSFSLSDDRKACITVQKMTEEGHLKITMVDETVTWRSNDSEAETWHPYGKVKACTHF